MTEESGWVHGLTDFLSQLYGLPGYVLVCLSCIALGYLLKLCRSFPNTGIPLSCVLWGMLFNLLIAPSPAAGSSRRIWAVTHLLVGMIVGLVAWLIHNKVLKRYENNWPIVGPAIAAASQSNPQPPVPPQVG